jgi:hypothetical protein
MSPEIIMFCMECGDQIKGQFAATCIKCVSKRGAQPTQATNSAMVPCPRYKAGFPCILGLGGKCTGEPCLLARHQ